MALLKADCFPETLRGVPEIGVIVGLGSHQLGQRPGDNIELLLGGFLRAATGVLQQHYQQQRKNARDSVDGGLPFLEIRPQRQAEQPGRHDTGTHEKERRPADPKVGHLDESIEQRTAISPRAGRCGFGMLHSKQPSDHHAGENAPITAVYLQNSRTCVGA